MPADGDSVFIKPRVEIAARRIHQRRCHSFFRNNLWQPRILFVEENIFSGAGSLFHQERTRIGRNFLIIQVRGREGRDSGLYLGRKTIMSAARNITRMQECGGAGAAGGLSFSDNGGDDDALPSSSLYPCLDVGGGGKQKKSFYNGASWGLGA